MISLSSATMDLGGQSGKETLAGIGNGSSLWDWGTAPIGHVVEGNNLIAGVRIDSRDMSVMETPLQATGMDHTGSIAPLVSDGSGIRPIAPLVSGDSEIEPIAPSESSQEEFTIWETCVWGGNSEMSNLEEKSFKSKNGVFDAKAFKSPTEAEFPRVY